MTNPHHAEISGQLPDASSGGGCPVNQGSVPLHGPKFQQTPADLYRDMRRKHGPVAPVVLEGGIPAWFVMGYRELHHVLSDSQLFARDCRRWNAWDQVPDDWPLMPFVGYQPSLLFAEGAEHQRRAGAVSDALGEVDQFELRTNCERIADMLIDKFVGSGEADLMAEYAHPIPTIAMSGVFGMPESQSQQLIADMNETMDGSEGSMAAHGRLQATMQDLLETKRARPGSDLPSRLLAHPAGLTDAELVQDLLVVMTAAQQPVAFWIGNTLRLMLTDRRFAVTLSGGRRSADQALNEVLWEDTPTQNFLGRWASRTTQLGGKRIEEGDLLVLGFAAANSDPSVRPDAYSGSFDNQAQMSFSHGEHCCPFPAPELGQIIAKAAVEVLLDRLPDVYLGVSPDALVWSPSVWMRGLTTLPVEFSPV